MPLAGHAAPDFSQSTITIAPEAPLEADVVRFTVDLINSGDTPAEFAQLGIEWPQMGYLVEFSGLEGATLDPETRQISASVHLRPGGRQSVHFDLLAPRDSGGDALSVSVRLAHFHSGTEYWDHKSATIDTRPAGTGVEVGGFRVTAAGLVVLAWLGLLVVVWLVVRLIQVGRVSPASGWRGLLGPGPTAAALMIPIGFWMIFAAMAWRDYKILHRWAETSATIIGRRTIAQSITSTSSRPSGSGMSKTSEVYTPELALRYPVAGSEIYSTGYDSGSSLRVGGRVRREHELREWVAGARIPCWYDPANPRDVVVRRGFGGAYLFALFPIPVFWIGLVGLHSAGCRRP